MGAQFDAIQSRSMPSCFPGESNGMLTWDPDLPRALSRLMPAASRLRRRLLDDELEYSLAEAVGERIRDRWNELEERRLYSHLIAAISQRFTIVDVYHSWPGHLSAYLRRSDFPENLLVDAHISATGNSTANLKPFLADVERLIALARPYVIDHPGVIFELGYFNGESLRRGDIQMHAMVAPNDPNTKKVAAALAICALLRDHHDLNAHRKWVILPTGEGVDWPE
jgi:hypothetical protein